jgi:hypothetical protein
LGKLPTNPRPPLHEELKGDEMYEEQIAEGIEFLDGWYGDSSWVLELDLGELDLKSGCNCVLGQLNGDYDTMCEILDIEEEDAVRLGFCLNYSELRKLMDPNVKWYQLTEEWKEAIKDRLDAGIEL